MRELTPEENARINRQLRGERGEPLSQSEIDRINRQLRGETANYTEEPEEEQTIENTISQLLIDYSIGNISDDIYVNINGSFKNKSGEILHQNMIDTLRVLHEINNDPIYALFNYYIEEGGQSYIFTTFIFERGISFYVNLDEGQAQGKVYWEDIKKITFFRRATIYSEDPESYFISNDPTFEIYKTCDIYRLYLWHNNYIRLSCLYFCNYELTDFLNDLVSKCAVFFQKENSYQGKQISYNQSFSQKNSPEIEIIRQTLIDYSIGNLSDNIFVNIDGYLRNKSGEYLNEEWKEYLREKYGDVPIYAVFLHSAETQNNQVNFFVTSILEKEIKFHAYYDNNNEVVVCSWYVAWKDIRNITFVKEAKPNDNSNIYTLEDDPTFMIYTSSISEVFHLRNDLSVYIPSTFFNNYKLTNFLNDLAIKCNNGSSYQNNDSSQYNSSYQNTYYQENQITDNILQDKKSNFSNHQEEDLDFIDIS